MKSSMGRISCGRRRIKRIHISRYRKKAEKVINKEWAVTNKEWALLDRKALVQIRLCLTKQAAFNISKEKTTSCIISALIMYYEK